MLEMWCSAQGGDFPQATTWLFYHSGNVSTRVWGSCSHLEHTKTGISSWSFSNCLCDLCPCHPAQPVLPWERDWLLFIYLPLEELLLLKHWNLFVCYLKVMLSLFKESRRWGSHHGKQLNHWCSLTSPAPLPALSPGLFATTRPNLPCWCCCCVCSPQVMALNLPRLVPAAGMRAMDGVLAAGMGPSAPCPSTNTSTRKHLLSARLVFRQEESESCANV